MRHKVVNISLQCLKGLRILAAQNKHKRPSFSCEAGNERIEFSSLVTINTRAVGGSLIDEAFELVQRVGIAEIGLATHAR